MRFKRHILEPSCLIFAKPGKMEAKKTKARPRTPKTKSTQQKTDIFLWQCKSGGLPAPQTEFHFDDDRNWRFDYAWPDHCLAVEREGGIWIQGRHTRGKGFKNDLEKYISATLHGWTVLRVCPDMIKDGIAFRAVKELIQRNLSQ